MDARFEIFDIFYANKGQAPPSPGLQSYLFLHIKKAKPHASTCLHGLVSSGLFGTSKTSHLPLRVDSQMFILNLSALVSECRFFNLMAKIFSKPPDFFFRAMEKKVVFWLKKCEKFRIRHPIFFLKNFSTHQYGRKGT